MFLHDFIPELQGGVCTGLIRQEFWYNGEQTDSAGVLFLQVDNGVWHRVFIDAGDLFWKIVSRPDETNTTANEEFHYPHVDEMARSDFLRGPRSC